jgi:membrane associated rhomboid family serine protease
MDPKKWTLLLDSIRISIRERTFVIFGVLAVLWGIQVVNFLLGGRLAAYGIRPRTWDGLWGVLFAPFLHSGFGHLLANSLTFIPLAAIVSLRRPMHLASVSIVVILLGGMGTWLLGRGATHVGASGVIFGYLGYLLAHAWFSREPLDIFISLGVAFSYGGILWGVLPSVPGVSWESHLFGALAGVFAAKYFL